MLSNFWDKLNKQKEKERKDGRKEEGRGERRKKEGGEGGRKKERRRGGREGGNQCCFSDRNGMSWWHSRHTARPLFNFRHHLSSLMR